MSDEAIAAVLAEFDAMIVDMAKVYEDSYSGDYYADSPFASALMIVEDWRDAFAARHGRPSREAAA